MANYIGINVLLFKKYDRLLAFAIIYFDNTNLCTHNKYEVFKSKDELVYDLCAKNHIAIELFYANC